MSPPPAVVEGRILKYALFPSVTKLELAVGTRVLHAAFDRNERLCIWVLSPHEDSELEHRSFQIFATGEVVPMDYLHWGTIHDGAYIWHVFEIPVIP